MRSSLTEYITQSASTRVERFYSLCFPVCDFIEKQHRKGKVLLRLNPDVIHVDSQTKQVELIYNSSEIDRFFPYISPEQTGRINRQVDYRSDLYSLGVVFYELLTGELPFRAEDALGWSYVHVTTEPKPPNKLNADIPLVLSDIIMKLLNKSPDERYQSIVGLCADLKRCCVEEQATGKVEPFILGQMDVSERLQFQTRLFGRDKETAILMEAYDRVCRGSTESVIISGYLGFRLSKTLIVVPNRCAIPNRVSPRCTT
jgi:serine/threonine protein kinase